ncbi:Bromodomain-containing protein [Biscogniauxia mediterranea]|nr:Bromodomain-containing protein [Biscogniauxia mediterranea]
MENKRKASGASGPDAAPDTPDRASKRRKLLEEFGDLSNGETPDSTTAYGLNILESIRATTDKNGRPIAPYFETLPSRSEDPEYYKVIRLPLSLQSIERKLKNRQYPTLSTLESDFKRLVSNVKETNDRTSVIFGDAERIRKAVSNLMVKQNPAYKLGNYQAVATPLPPSPGPEDAVDDEDAEGEEDAEAPAASGADAEEGEGEEEEEGGEEEEEPEAVEAAEVEEEAEDNANDANEDEGAEDGEEEDGEEEEEEDEDPKPRRRGRKWKGGSSRAPRTPRAQSQKSATRGPVSGKADHHYENVPFKGLSFQQAQEKVVEELIRKKDDSDYPYFEPFIYLPPRSLKDYYEIIAEPLSLKALQKQVRGQHGRSEATYVSDFKAWAAFEDQASLIWKNAYHYNEDGSEISLMAQELEENFYELMKEAKHHVPEPPQPKIKLKVPQNAETPGHPKKITIHVGGKASATGSPAPATGQSGEAEATRNSTPLGRNPFGGPASSTAVNLNQLEKARSMSASAGPPSPSPLAITKAEDTTRQSPAIMPQTSVSTFQQFVPVAMHPSGLMPNGTALQQQQQQPPPPPPPKKTAADILEAQKYRPRPIKEEEALMPRLVICSHPTLQVDSRLSISIPASATEYQQEIFFNAPASHYRLQLKPHVAGFLEAQQREWRLNVLHDTTRLYPSSVAFDKRGEPVFDVSLHYGTNRLEVSLVAALPKGEKSANELNMELEKFVVYFNLLKHP